MLGAWILLVACSDGNPVVVPTVGTLDPVENVEGDDVAGILEAHNVVRAEHGVEPLVYSTALSETAAAWIEHLDAEGCILEHDYSSPLGENLFWTSATSDGQEVVDAWVSEIQFYDYETDTCEPGEMCGHYTQVVWHDTQAVGCAVRTCAQGQGEIWMCTYDPAGNTVGERPY